MKDFFCANCRKYKNIELRVMIKKTNWLMQAKCKTCVDKTKVKA
jgi:RNase P subunit RPR2